MKNVIRKIVKRIKRGRYEREQELILLKSIADDMHELRMSIDFSSKYGNAIKTTTAVRY